MSDLYLTLRRRLDEVADWVDLGTETMRTARKQQGFSYESLARLVPTSSKTYERWEKRGQVPRHIVPRIAQLLDLEIEQPARTRVSVPDATAEEPDAGLAEVLAEVRAARSAMADLQAGQDDIVARLARLEARRDRRSTPPASVERG